MKYQRELFGCKIPVVAPPPSGGLDRWDAGTLKSAVHKYIRRGETGKATAVVIEYMRKNPASLLRRIPVMAAEDCGAKGLWTLSVMPRGVGSRASDYDVEVVVRIVQFMAMNPKDKDGFALGCGVALANGVVVCGTGDELRTRLRDALSRCDEPEAARLAVGAFDNGQAGIMWEVLSEFAEPIIMNTLRDRASFQCGRWDALMIIGTAILYCCHWRNTGPPAGWDSCALVTAQNIRTLDWYCVDMHTVLGKIVLNSMAKKRGITAERLSNLWWWFSSSVCDRYEPQRWFDFWKSNMIQRGYTPESAAAEWAGLAKDVEGFVLWLMDKRGLS